MRSVSVAEETALAFTSLRTIAEALNECGIPTAQGGKWFAPQVARVLVSLGER
jgi:hypothetical protein